jgi:hypothetical protein
VVRDTGMSRLKPVLLLLPLPFRVLSEPIVLATVAVIAPITVDPAVTTSD